ncbi:MAG: IgA Peptidase M64 [Prevotella sp.]|nr:IgA Peptidase M64 [Prevotella sp.]MDD5895322.1 M64 family metallopeptidase [Prevotellaceae bacterium]
MKANKTVLFIVTLLCCVTTDAQNFDDYFTDNTLRLDYIFAGDRTRQGLYVDKLVKIKHWYGRRKRLNQLPYEGNGQITVTDSVSGDVIYRHSFSTLFQEWLTSEESKNTPKSFENVFLVPFPKNTVNIKVELFDYHRKTFASMCHTVNPSDILIRTIDVPNNKYVTIQKAADTTNCIHIAYVAEGYTKDQMDSFVNDAHKATNALFDHEPFKRMKQSFNIVCVESESKQEGTSTPHKLDWKNTALGSHFDTFYSNRYLTTLNLKRLHDELAGAPYEHIIVLVNTEQYGGGGIYNSYNLSYTKGPHFLPVVVHEFGHSFGALADEYEYADTDPMYFSDTEPWEPNITTKADFSQKWQNLIDQGKAGLIEGGGYQSKGVWRGVQNCRMRTNECKDFCPVCQQALQRLIDFYVK